MAHNTVFAGDEPGAFIDWDELPMGAPSNLPSQTDKYFEGLFYLRPFANSRRTRCSASSLSAAE